MIRRLVRSGALALALLAGISAAQAAQTTMTTPGAPLTMSGLATFLNNGFLTLGSKFSGATPPAVFGSPTITPYQDWVDTSGGATVTYKTYDGAQWVTIGTLNTTTHAWLSATPAAAGSNGQLQTNSSGALAGVTLGGDCTFSSPNVTCTKTNGVSFGTSATVNTGTSGATIPLLNGANTWASNQSFSGVLLGSNGSASAPTHSFSGDTNKGMFSGGANRLSFSTAGVTALSINSAQGVELGGLGGAISAVFDGCASCVNYMEWSGALTTSPPSLNMRGTDTDVGLSLAMKGAGVLRVIGTGTAASPLVAVGTAGYGFYQPGASQFGMSVAGASIFDYGVTSSGQPSFTKAGRLITSFYDSTDTTWMTFDVSSSASSIAYTASNGFTFKGCTSFPVSACTVAMTVTANVLNLTFNIAAIFGAGVTFASSATGAGVQTFTNSPCSGLTTERWIPVSITGQSGTWNIPACQ